MRKRNDDVQAPDERMMILLQHDWLIVLAAYDEFGVQAALKHEQRILEALAKVRVSYVA